MQSLPLQLEIVICPYGPVLPQIFGGISYYVGDGPTNLTHHVDLSSLVNIYLLSITFGVGNAVSSSCVALLAFGWWLVFQATFLGDLLAQEGE